MYDTDLLPLAPLIMSLSKVVGLPDRCESERSKLPDLNIEIHLWRLQTSKAFGETGHDQALRKVWWAAGRVYRCSTSSCKAEFTPRQSASSVKRLANQRLHLGRNEVSDWLDARHSTFVRLGVNEP
ncbi:hypothetical protein TNCV_463881 [Trichonephila clavipes]|nr:hypothetical protein TNCV_463881 [Trichonephila clavipes]